MGTIRLTAAITGGAAHHERKGREAARQFVPEAHGWTVQAVQAAHPTRSEWLIALRAREAARLARIDGWRAAQTVRWSSREPFDKSGQTPDPRAPLHEPRERVAPRPPGYNLTEQERWFVARIRAKKDRQAGLIPTNPTTKAPMPTSSDGREGEDQSRAVGQFPLGFRP